ncbi:MAG: hypothetical protein JWM40_708 [Frankiales bacterium]|nr:hypothetical protein [Frankiales bacterium]
MTTITTHDPAGGGNPRLLFTLGEHHDRTVPSRRDFPLQRGVTTIGSDPGNDLCLAGLARFHAEIHRDDRDDYVLTSVAGSARVHGRPVTEAELHSGARIELGGWVMSYARAESADHGRPDGGRQGGELSAGPRVGA